MVDEALKAAGAYPLLQIVLIMVVLAGGVLALVKSLRDAKSVPPPPAATPSSGVQMYFDGPLVEMRDLLRQIAKSLSEIPAASQALREERRQISEEIGVTRHNLRDLIQREIVVRLEQDLENEVRLHREEVQAIESRLREAEQQIARMQGRT